MSASGNTSSPANSATLGLRRALRHRRNLRLVRTWSLPLVLMLAVLALAALAPISTSSRDELFEIPRGAHARRLAGGEMEVLPDTIRLTLGAKDVLLLRNLDEAPQVFGPVLIMPGQSVRLPFEVASTYSFACTAHASGHMSVIVDRYPARGWQTLAWRARHLRNKLMTAVQAAGPA